MNVLRSSLAITGVLVSLLTAGCAQTPPRLEGLDNAASAQDKAALWTFSTYTKQFMESMNYAKVMRVDGVTISRGVRDAPYVFLAPGRYTVEIRHEKDLPIPGYFGSPSVHRVSRTLDLTVEAGRSYMPFARRHCDQDWVWIVDTGNSAAEEVAQWERDGSFRFSARVRARDEDTAPLRVVAGERPPETCVDQPADVRELP